MKHFITATIILIMISAVFMPGAAKAQSDDPVTAALLEMTARLGLPAPVTEAEYNQMAQEYNATPDLAVGQTLARALTMIGSPELTGKAGTWGAGYHSVVMKKTGVSSITDLYLGCRRQVGVIIYNMTQADPTDFSEMLQAAELGFEQSLAAQGTGPEVIQAMRSAGFNLVLETRDYRGAQIQLASLPEMTADQLETGRKDYAIWKQGDWLFSIIAKSFNSGREDNGAGGYRELAFATCPIPFDSGPDIQAWYEALYDAAQQTMFGAPAEALPTEMPAENSLRGKLTDGHGLPLPYIHLRLVCGAYEKTTLSNLNGEYSIKGLPGLLDPGFDITEDLCTLEITFQHQRSQDSAPYFKLIHKNENNPTLSVTTMPFPINAPDGNNTLDVDLANAGILDTNLLAQMDANLPQRVDDLAASYAHTAQALELAHQLGNPLDLPFDLVTYLPANGACWRGQNTDGDLWGGCLGLQRQVAAVGLGEQNQGSDYADWNRPGNREWHEFGHQFMADSFGNRMPSFSGRLNHDGLCINGKYSTDAWTEGFAEFYSMMVAREIAGQWDFFLYQDGQSSKINMEMNYMIWADPFEELAAAGVLLDLVDSGSDYIWLVDDDNVAVSLQTLWDAILKGASTESAGNGHIHNMTDLARNLAAQGIGTGDLDGNQIPDLSDIFIAHGYHENIDGNWLYQTSDRVAYTTHPAYTHKDASGAVTQSCAASPSERRDLREAPGSFLAVSAVDQNGQSMQPATFRIDIQVDPPYEAYSYSYEVPSDLVSDGRLYLTLPPVGYPAQAQVMALAEGYSDSQTVLVTTDEYWAHVPNDPNSPIAEQTFVLTKEQPDDILAIITGLGILGILGGGAICLGGIVVVVGGVILVTQRRKPKPQPAPYAYPAYPQNPPPAYPYYQQPAHMQQPAAYPPPLARQKPMNGWLIAVLAGAVVMCCAAGIILFLILGNLNQFPFGVG